MKRIITFLLIGLILTACRQEEQNIQSKAELSNEQASTIEEVEVAIAAVTDEEAVGLIRSYIAKELDRNAYSGLFLEYEPSKHFVILIQDLYPLQEAAANLENYSKQNGKSEGVYRVKLKSATYSYQTLEKLRNQLSASFEELIVTERRILSLGINERENRVDLYASAPEDLNEDLINEITVGFEGIVKIEEGVMSSLGDNGLPTTKPYIIGTIQEKKEEENLVFLIEGQVNVLVNGATVIKDYKGNPIGKEQLNVGDQVAVWIDGGMEDSLPASGYAVAIQLN